MKNFEYFAPTKIIFGKATHERAGELLKLYGAKRVLLIYGSSSVLKSGLLNVVEENIKKEAIEVLSIGGVVANPLLSKALEIRDKGIEFAADFVLALGGGSVIDTAKLVAHGVANKDKDIWNIVLGKEKIDKSLPHAAIVTISAAGSETSDSAVITNDLVMPHIKRGVNTEYNRCKFTIMNPELTYTLPKYQVAAGVADIFMHTAERYFAATFGNHLSDEMGEGLLRNIIKFGVIGVENSHDYEAMSEIMWSGSISHVGLTGLGSKGDTPREGDWACHQLSMPLSSMFFATHGAALTAVWCSWAEYVKNANIERFAKFAKNVLKVQENDVNKAADVGILKTKEFFSKIGMPNSITGLLGRTLSEEELKELALNCSYNGSRTIGGFKVLDKDDIYNIYKMANSERL